MKVYVIASSEYRLNMPDMFVMDNDEVLRLKQISGLASLFRDRDFSEAKEL